ncbi:cobalamin biosynthesis protein [Aeromonas veronii]|uniref:cobalamin biosynthesis protein n=1 Tax=Aeromonas veronii TaxID=654 RepID=UPI00187EA274|nr:cobalamin biosynthesis protein CobD [Aeromonas veronii]MBE8740031.1 cobalamin biosynthesis protein CobD [Aeromonas veronii]MBE8742565.1 cobalamin biosynthesis protein CobD [Aeromonas veronii]MBE8765607.1 cobalamin biosynthesis protein CobD [Aeromonas veronii]MBE8838114.1 cobalamin biosynthesis protein CobD [Aeromonas veronii]
MIETGSLDLMADALLSTTAAILVGAALLEAVIPWPSHLRLSAVTLLLTRLGHKVHRPDGSPGQQMQAGLLAMLVVWLPCAAGLWSLRNLALSEPIFDLLFLLLMIESRPLRELAHATHSLATQETLPLARLQSAPWLKRETGKLSTMGLAKAVTESCALRLVGQWAGPLLGFALAGVQGALLWRLVQLMNQSWSRKDPAFDHFGRAASALYQGLNAPVILLLGLPLLASRLKQAVQLLRSGALWPYPAMGMLLTLLVDKSRIRLGGPRYYQGALQRWPIIGTGAEPDSEIPRKVLNILQGCGWGWLILALLVTLAGLFHG